MAQFDKEEIDDVKEWQSIIADLCSKAPNDTIRDCLRLYDPSKPSKQIKAALNRCRKEILCDTLTYLGRPDSENERKANVLESLIWRIKNLFPDKCQICHQRYCITLRDDKFLPCSICGQEVHKECFLASLKDNNLLSMTNKIIPFNVPGFYYLCTTCESELIPTIRNRDVIADNHDDVLDLTKEDINITEKVAKANADQIANDTAREHIEPDIIVINPRVSSHNDNNKNDNKYPMIDDEDVSIINKNTPHHRTEFMRNRLLKMKDQSLPLTSTNQTSSLNKPTPNGSSENVGLLNNQQFDQKNQKVCRHFLKGNCKYGMSGKDCMFYHPKFCKKLMKHGTKKKEGCSKGKSCEHFHPKMCPTSIAKLECFDDHCELFHIKRTKRRRDPLNTNISHDKKKHFSSRVPKPESIENSNFLEEAVSLLKREINAMDKKLSSVLTQFNALQHQLPLLHSKPLIDQTFQNNNQRRPIMQSTQMIYQHPGQNNPSVPINQFHPRMHTNQIHNLNRNHQMN